MHDYAERITALRHRLGLTEHEFGKLMGVHFTSVYRWEGKYCAPSSLAWEKFLRFEKLSTQTLRKRIREMNNGR